MEDPWGRDTPPAVSGEPPPLPPRLAELGALAEPRELAPDERFVFPSATELPEVQTLTAGGWRPLEPASAFVGLPAVWPVEHRCWVADRLPKVHVRSAYGGGGADGRRWIVPTSDDDFTHAKDFETELAREAGLSAPPRGRIWLLRSPWPSLGLEVVVSILATRADETLGNPGVVELVTVAREVLPWAEDQVWSSWGGPRAEAARQWRRLGRVGEAATDVVLRGLTPAHVATLIDPEGAALTEAQAVAWVDVVDGIGEKAVRRIEGWRALGLPAHPPAQMEQLVEESPSEVDRWLTAGFSLDDVATLLGVPLTQALRWREAGFDTTETERLLRADPTLTPEEARTFTEAGISDDDRLGWVEAGFSATEASAWTDLDIVAGEARVWRSVGRGPADAREYRESGGGPLPPDVPVGWGAVGSGGRELRKYGVTDPPGTRGRIAQEHRPHLWRRGHP